MIESYNEKMGGVDLVDIMVACYRYSNSDMLKLYNIYFYLFLLQGPPTGSRSSGLPCTPGVSVSVQSTPGDSGCG